VRDSRAHVAVRFAARPDQLPPAPARWDELPRVELVPYLLPSEDTVSVELEAWRSGSIDFYQLDAHADALGERGLVPVAASGDPDARLQLLTRCQRWLDRRNHGSRQPWFAEVLGVHWSLHDRNRPLVRADHNHALDTWQWLLRLEPAASAAAQVAALFHDIERPGADADRRAGEDAGSRDEVESSPAEDSARRLLDLLSGSGAEAVARRAADLVAASDRPGEGGSGDDDLALLEDADSLSFLSLSSGGFLDHHGEKRATREIGRTLSRLSLRALRFLNRVRLRRDVEALLERVLTRTL
jgi:hypothetical protein